MVKTMNRNESRYFKTAAKMDEAFLRLIEEKDLEFITVKEICNKAGVNRSTFYLHYETIDDLLSESLEYMNGHFLDFMGQKDSAFIERISQCQKEELYLVTPKYLEKYLEYVKSNRHLFENAVKRPQVLRLDESYEKMFRFVFTPILERCQVPEENRRYLMAFYIHGIMAIITEWLKSNCEDSVEQIMSIIQKCVTHGRNQ